MSSEAITNNLLIEGFDPSKLETIEESSHDKGWKEIYGAYQNKTVLQATMVAIDELQIGTDEKETCAIVQVEDIRGFIPIREFGVDNKKQLRAFSGTKVAF